MALDPLLLPMITGGMTRLISFTRRKSTVEKYEFLSSFLTDNEIKLNKTIYVKLKSVKMEKCSIFF